MIRGPVLPQMRDGLWALVSGRLDQIERGLVLVMEGFDCCGGQLGLVEGVARDAIGAPVLVVLALDGDPLLAPRVLAAADFLQRVGDGLAAALPEGGFSAGVDGRILVIGTDVSANALEQLRRLPAPGVQICRLEPFRVAGSERFAVRYLRGGVPAADRVEAVCPPEFVVPEAVQDLWRGLHDLCVRIDRAVRIDGDRYWRRICWQGHLLGEVRLVDGVLRAVPVDGSERSIQSVGDVRAFGDQLLRRFVLLAGLAKESGEVAAGAAATRQAVSRQAASSRVAAPRGGDGLRASMVAARVSPEEYSALGGPASEAGGEAEGAATADDVVRIVSAQESSWPPPRRSAD